MRVALVNPRWDFTNSIYFGCPESHLPLELGYAAQRLEEAGHEALLLDGQLDGLENEALADRVADAGAGLTVVTTAPTYLFWRCAHRQQRHHRRRGRSLLVGRCAHRIGCRDRRRGRGVFVRRRSHRDPRGDR